MSYGDDLVMPGRRVHGKNPAVQRSSDERSFFERRAQWADRCDAHEKNDCRTERQRTNDTGGQAGFFLKRFVGVFGLRPLSDAGTEVAHDNDDGNDDADKAETAGGLPGQMARFGDQLAGPAVNAKTRNEREDCAKCSGQFTRESALPAFEGTVDDVSGYEQIDEIHGAGAY